MTRSPHRRAALLSAALAATVLGAPTAADAATYNVNTTADTTTCTTASCSLRGAVSLANATTDSATTINVAAGAYKLGAPLTYNVASGFSLTIAGASTDTTTITGPANGAALAIEGGANLVSLADLSIRGSRVNGTISPAIDSEGVSVSLSGVTIADNILTTGGNLDAGFGGAVSVYGSTTRKSPSLTIIDSTFTGNEIKGGAAAASVGGAVWLESETGKLDLNGVTFDSNRIEGAQGSGGAAAVEGGGSLVVRNSTFSGNSAARGAAVLAGKTGSITNTTIVGNTGASSVLSAGGAVSLRASILAAPGAACATSGGTFTDAGSNLDSGTSCGTAGLTNADPRLEPLALRGFITAAMVPKPGSPVIDAVSGACPTDDQRYTSVRPNDGNGDGVAACDIGSVEYTAPLPDKAPTDTAPTFSTINLAGGIVAPDAPSTAYFEYGPTTAYGQRTAPVAIAALESKDLAITLTGLTANTLYHYRLVGNDGAADFRSADRTFRTTALPAIDGNRPNPVGITTATFNGRVDPNNLAGVTWRFEYGTTPALGAQTEPTAVTGPSFVAVAKAVAGLAPSTTYYWRLVARVGTTDVAGNIGTFTTAAPTPIALTVGPLKKYRIGKAFTATAKCAPGCTLKVSLSVSPKTAKKLKLKSPIIASASGASGTVTLPKLKKKLASKLKALKPKSLTLSFEASPTSIEAARTVLTQVVKVGK